jgi:type IV pilus assembly protein PilC
MLAVGAQSNDLPGVLTMLADHYQKRHVVATRLKGLMVYPAIVLFGAFLLSCFLCILLHGLIFGALAPGNYLVEQMNMPSIVLTLWAPPILLGLVVLVFGVALASAKVRRELRWRLPAFKEASLAQIASALALMLKSGVPLDNAVGLVEDLERGTPAEADLIQWRHRLASGKGKISAMMEGGRIFPPLFIWTVSQAGEDLATGFQRAAETYQARASYRTELLLYSALPCSVLALGLTIVLQIQPVLSVFGAFMNAISDAGK